MIVIYNKLFLVKFDSNYLFIVSADDDLEAISLLPIVKTQNNENKLIVEEIGYTTKEKGVIRKVYYGN